jgi:hypothetical protein
VRGQFTGHYLSALAFIYNSTGERRCGAPHLAHAAALVLVHALPSAEQLEPPPAPPPHPTPPPTPPPGPPGNATVLSRLQYMVKELQKVQLALGGGYLSAFPASHFDRLEALQPVWAPYYVRRLPAQPAGAARVPGPASRCCCCCFRIWPASGPTQMHATALPPTPPPTFQL